LAPGSEEIMMTDRPSRLRSPLGPALAGAVLILCSLAVSITAQADDLLGFYVGGAFGQAHVRAQLNGLSAPAGTLDLGGFDGTDSAFQAMLGVRLLSFLGAEVAYADLGQHSIRGGPGLPATGPLGTAVTGERVSQKGEAAFAMLYLPVPIIDVYVKAGVSRITTDMHATYVLLGVSCVTTDPSCADGTAGRSSSDVGFAYGAGVQWKLGQWAVRGEYERFDAAGANPSLLSIGMTYWIL